MCNNPLFHHADWNIEDINKIWSAIDKLAKEKYKLDYYEPLIEIVSADQMLEAMSYGGMPVMYDHWSFGKQFIQSKQKYDAGKTNLPYELIINTDPATAYLMDNNSTTMQTLTLCHAVVGHSSFFKQNYLFKTWTDAKFIMEYLKYAKKYIRECEKKYGEDDVELLLNACHVFERNGIDKYIHSHQKESEKERARKWEEEKQKSYNEVWSTIKKTTTKEKKSPFQYNILERPNENVLYCAEKYSPCLKVWEREIVRIVRTISQYFYPQFQTKVMNEGWASFWHYRLMTDLHEEGLLTDGAYIEFLASHTAVLNQGKYGHLNPYVLGFHIYMDIKRMCEEPDEEDLRLFPDICNTDWLETLKDITANYRDESFIRQFLSPKVVKKLKLFNLHKKAESVYMVVTDIAADKYFKELRNKLAENYMWERNFLEMEVFYISKYPEPTILVSTLLAYPANKTEYTIEEIEGIMPDVEVIKDYLQLLFGENARAVIFDKTKLNAQNIDLLEAYDTFLEENDY